MAILATAALLIAWQLFVPPVLSVADDNDFQKLASRACIATPAPDLFAYITVLWHISTEACNSWPYRTSAELVLRTAVKLDGLAGHLPNFDTRWMGAIYTLLFLVCCAWAQRLLRATRPATSRVLQIAFVVAICNAVYVPMFNTFYFDTMALVMMIGVVAGVGRMSLAEEVKGTTLLATCVALTLVAASKGQHSLLAVSCLPVIWAARGREVYPPVWARVAASLAVIAGTTVALGTTPPYQEGQVTYNALFLRILPSVPNPADYLAETRIPARYLSAIGTDSYSPESPNYTYEQQIAFARMFSIQDLALFYLRHPDRAWYMMKVNLEEASLDRVRLRYRGADSRLGNYERATGKPPESQSSFFCLWAALKMRVVGGHPVRYLVYILSLIAAAWLLAPRRPGMYWFLGTITAILAISFAIPMTDGLDGGRHLQMFNYLLDLLVCGIAAFAAERLIPGPAVRNPKILTEFRPQSEALSQLKPAGIIHHS